MKHFITALIAAMMSISVVACSADTDTTSAADETATVQEDVSTTEEEVSNEDSTVNQTQIISTSKGDVEVPINPSRVVVDYFVGDVYAMGVTPVGVAFIHEGAFFEEDLADVPRINGETSYGDYSMETILSLNPDLIITSTESEYDNLSKIAPTIYIDSLSTGLDERIALIGQALGKTDEAQALLDSFYENVEVKKAELEQAGILDKTVTIFETVDKEIYVYGDKQGRGGEILYNLLGMKAPEIVQQEIVFAEQYRSLSLEVLNDYIGDIVMITGWMSDPMDLVGDNSVWLSSKAVSENHVFIYNSGAYIYSDIISLNAQLEEITSAFLEMYQ